MAKNRFDVEMRLGYVTDQAGLQKAQQQLQRIVYDAGKIGQTTNKGLQEAAAMANKLDSILTQTFNKQFNTTSMARFATLTKEAGISVRDMQTALVQNNRLGATGFNLLGSSILNTNVRLKQSSKLLDTIAHTLKQSFQYQAAGMLFRQITSSIQNAYSYVQDLDQSLNDIRIVTDKSANSMAIFAKQANAAAKSLGATTLDYTKASLIYYQQGLSDEDVQARANTTIKAANVTGQSASEVSEQLTAVWNGYKVSAEEAELYVDKLAAVAATTASDLEELSTGMSKVASAANSMGVGIDQLNAMLSTVISVTRQAPETAGTAMKTIFARMGDLELNGEDEDGVSLGAVSSSLESVGIHILDVQGQMRDLGDVIEEVGAKWNSGVWSDAEKTALAIDLAGKRQYNNLLALFDNWDMYQNAIATSTNAVGTLQKQQDIYMQSTEAKLNTLRSTWQELYGDLLQKDTLDAGIEAITNLVKVFDRFIASFGGGSKALLAFGTLVANIFNKQITQSIINAQNSFKTYSDNVNLLQTKQQLIATGVQKDKIGSNFSSDIRAKYGEELKYAEKIADIEHTLTQEEYNQLTAMQAQSGELAFIENGLQRELDAQMKKYNPTDTFKKALADGSGDDYLEQREVELLKAEEKYEADVEKANQALDDRKQKLKEIEEQLANIKKISIDYSSIPNNTFSGKPFKKQLDSQGIHFSDADAKSITQAYNSVTDQAEKEKAVQEQIKKILQDKITIVKQEIGEEQKKIANAEKTYSTIKSEVNGERQILDAQNKVNESVFKRKELELEINQIIKNAGQRNDILKTVTGITSAMSSAAMAWSSFSSLFKTLSDDTAKFSDKMTQTLMTIGMGLPMAISSFQRLGDAIGISSQMSALLRESETASLALNAKSTLQKGQQLGKQELENYLKANNIVLTDDQKNKVLELAAAEDLETKAKIKSISKTELLGKVIMKNPMFLWITAITAVVAGLSLYISHLEKAAEKQKKLNDQTIKEAETLKAESDNVKELNESYSQLYRQYKNNVDVKNELGNASDQLAKKFNNEEIRLQALRGEYDKVAESIRRKRLAQLEDEEYQYKKASKAAATNFLDDKKVKKKTKIDSAGYGFSQEAYNILSENLDESNLKYINYDEINGIERYSLVLDNQNQTAETLLKQINTFRKIEKELVEAGQTSDPAYVWIKNFLETAEDSENYNKLVEQASFEKERRLEHADLTSKLSYSANTSEFNKNYQDFVKELEGNEEEALDYVRQMDNEYANLWLAQKEAFKNANNDVKDYVDTLSDEDLKLAVTLYVDENTSKEEIQKGIDALTQQIRMKSAYDVTEAAHVASELLSQKSLNKDDTSNLNNNIEILKNSGYGALLGDFDNKSLIERQMILNQIVEINDRIMVQSLDMSKAEKTEQLKTSTAAVEKRREIAELEEQLAKLSNKSYISQEMANELQVLREELKLAQEEYNKLIKGTATTEEQILEYYDHKVDNLVNIIQSLSKAGNNIEQGFVISLENAEELNKLMPEIFKNSQALNDGTIQLDKETAEYVLNAKKEEIRLEKEQLISNLKNKRQELVAKKEEAEKQLEFIESLSGQELTIEDVKEKAKEAGIKDFNAFYDKAAEKYLDSVKNTDAAALESTEKYVNAKIGLINSLTEAWDEEHKAETGQEHGFGKTQSYQNEIKNIKAIKANASKINLDEFGSDTKQVETFNKMLAEALKQEIGAYDIDISNYDYEVARLQAELANLDNVGKGSGSDKNNELKRYRDEFDLYWDLNNAIEMVEDSLSDFAKIQEKLYNKELISSLKSQNELLTQQAGIYEELAAAQQNEANLLQRQLAEKGITFDADGAITNYAAVTLDALNKYNEGVLKKNAGLITEQGFESIEQDYENFKDLLDRYDTLYYDEMVDTQNKLDDLRYEIMDNNLKAWEVELEFNLDLQKAERDWNDFLHEINKDFRLVYENLGDTIENSLANIQTYLNENGTIQVQLDAISDVEGEIDKISAGEGSDKFLSISQAQEKLKELQDQLYSSTKDLKKQYQDVWDTYLNGIDQAKDKLDELMDKYELFDKELEFQKDLIQLLYGPESYGLMDRLYEAQRSNALIQLDSLRQQRDMWQQLYESAEEGSKDQQKYYENWNAAQDSLNNKTIEYIRLLKEDYKNTISSILKTFETQVAGTSLKDLEEDWDRVAEDSKNYYDSIEKAYETQNFADKIREKISNTNSLKAQQKLQALYDKEVGYLRDKEKLTKYDIDAANAKLAIVEKELALEDAMNNKTSMKLTRGIDGNWSYQYIADQDGIIKAQQDLSKSYQDLYQLADKAYEENLTSLQALQKKYLESAQKIAQDETLSEERKNEKMLELNGYYQQRYNELAEQNKKYRIDLETDSFGILLNLYKQDEENFNYMTDREKESIAAMKKQGIDDFLTLETAIEGNLDNIGDKAEQVMKDASVKWTSGAQGLADVWNADDGISVKSQVTIAYEEITSANESYMYSVDELEETVRRDFSEDGIVQRIEEAEDATYDLRDATEDLVDSIIPDLDNMYESVLSIGDAWNTVKRSVEDAANKLREYINIEGQAYNASAKRVSITGGSYTQSSTDLENPGGTGNPDGAKDLSAYTYKYKFSNDPHGTVYGPVTYKELKAKSEKWDYDGQAGNVTIIPLENGKLIKGSENGFNFNLSEVDDPARQGKGRGAGKDAFLKWLELLKFDTGGYTGDWTDNSGKLAVLHSKELVLNQKDTSNILAAVDGVRQLSGLNTSISESIMNGVANMINSMSNLGTHSSYRSSNNSVSNKSNIFNIGALDFPGLNDVNIIKDALLNLPNVVSQITGQPT